MEKDFEKTMENLKTPNTEFVKHQENLKIGLLNSKKSARIGILFIAAPIILIVGVFLKIKLLMKIGFYQNFIDYISINEQHSTFDWFFHISLLFLPVIAIIINIIAITHFQVIKPNKELIITVRYQFKNLIVIIISIAFIFSVLSYIILMK